MEKKAIFAERLGILDFALLWALSRMKNADILYNERKASAAAVFLAAKSGRFYPAGLDFNKTDPGGFGIVYEMQDNIRAIVEIILAPADRLPEWARASAALDIRGLLEYRIVFIESARHRAGQLGLKDVEFYALSTFFDSEIAAHYADGKRAAIGFLPCLRGKARVLAVPLLALLKSTMHAPLAGSLKKVRPAVWVEYCIPGIFAHAFWHKHIKTSAFDEIYYLDRADTPASPAIISRIAAEGMGWVDLHDVRLFKMSGLKFADLRRVFIEVLRLPGLSMKLRFIVLKHYLWHEAYVRVFSAMRVKLLVQHQDRGWQQPVQADAVSAAGGIMAGYNWSNLPYPMKDWYQTSQHVYFVWGKNSFEAILKMGRPCRHILPSGLWLEESPLPENLKEFAAHRGFKLTVFDSDVSYDIWQSPATLSEFFHELLALLERRGDWRALLKCKFAEAGYLRDIPGGTDIWRKIEALVKQGRIFVADPRLSPITAGKCADLSVCYTLNSAGLCAQIRGARAVHWDAVGLRYPLFAAPGQKVVFRRLAEMLEAVEQAARGDKSVGDLAPWRHLYDQFGDENGARRIADFIGDYMREVLAAPSLSGLAVADKVAARYLKKNGIGESFFSGFDFWS